VVALFNIAFSVSWSLAFGLPGCLEFLRVEDLSII